MEKTWIQIFGGFSITVGDQCYEHLPVKSRKGVSLLTYLMLRDGKPVSSQRLIREMWSAKTSCNPEGALKTMISRLRATLNDINDGLGGCIQSAQGSYCWQSGPDVRVDAIEFMRLLENLKIERDSGKKRAMYRRIQEIYQGDLGYTGDLVGGLIQTSWMHREYLEAMYAYVQMLREDGDQRGIRGVCRQGLRVDDQDAFFRVELARAECALDRQGKTETGCSRALPSRRGDAQPEETYHEAAAAGSALQSSLEAIRQELQRQEQAQDGPFFCDYVAFKEFYHVQVRSLERLGSTVFLGLIMVAGRNGGLSDVSRESAMAGLQEILRRNLRKGDIITRFSANTMAMLLPNVSFGTGGTVLERIETLFRAEYPSPHVVLHHRITPLGAG
ncbi:MAG: winged helix-turn-helix domain-containing protein [Clostridia bacterium]|nr:winged helix-turn-helix domain-containing protein [Clostridia bacterium]